MKKLFAKLALFASISILLAMPLRAFAISNYDECISKEDKNNFVITILEEPFGSADMYKERKDGDKTIFKVVECCRVTTTAADGTVMVNLLERSECGSNGTDSEGFSMAEEGEKVTTEQVMAIMSKGGTTMIQGYISVIYTWAASLVGLISVTVIIISGIQIAMSGGDTQAVESGKNRIVKSISGLAVLFLSGLILYTINPNFFAQ